MKTFHRVTLTNLAVFFIAFTANVANAACSGCNQTVNLTLNNQLGINQNVEGYTSSSSSFTVGSINTGYGTSQKGTSFTFLGGELPNYGYAPSSWVYQRIDEYLSVAVRLRQQCGYIYAPFNRQTWAARTCKPQVTSGNWDPTTWDSSIRVDRKMVGGTYRKNILLGTWGGCNGSSCQFQDQVYARVYLNYNITVPQNCVINAGEVISVDFGSLPSTAFYSPGVKAKNVNPITRVVSMQCNNIETQTPVRLRVEANLASGNAIVSDNRDVGFVIGSNDGKELTPNLFSSYIPFRTSNEGGTSSVPIVIWPVSVTGRTPNEGPVTALGFLRIDFD